MGAAEMTDTATIEAPATIDQDERMTLPEYCDAAAIYGDLRWQMVEAVDAYIDIQLEAGNEVESPFRMTRWWYYRRYNELMMRDEAETMASVRAASYPI